MFDSSDSLSGVTMSIELNTIEEYLLEEALVAQDIELDIATLRVEDLPPPVLQEALLNGTIHTGYASEPWVTRATETGEAEVWLSAEEIAPNLQASMMLYGPRLLNEDPELGERFMIAYLQGVRRYNEGVTERTVEILHQYTDLEPTLIEAACWTAISDDGAIRTEGLMAFQEWLIEREMMDEIVPVEDFWNPRFVEAAVAVLDQQ
jgi:NitT/TauT family transport system substrate-binding protein